jgi:hypothetical protein
MTKEYTMLVSGCAAGDVCNYELGELVQNTFGDNVETDCESSCFYAYVTAEMADEVWAFVKVHGGEGEMFSTYGAGDFMSEFNLTATL